MILCDWPLSFTSNLSRIKRGLAWVAHEVPQLELDLPWSAFGSGYASRSD
jgi:hypothetical protein